MLDQLAPVLVLTVVVIVFAVLMIGGTFLAGPKRIITPEKQMPYECGIPGKATGTSKLPVKFYLTAILFILFDIEVIFLYPWTLIFREFIPNGPFVLVEMAVFMFVLGYGLLYVWKARALDWD